MMCRIDPELHDAASQRNGCRLMERKGQQINVYLYVSAAVIRAQKEFEYSIMLALD
jgi:hypothetical protein